MLTIILIIIATISLVGWVTMFGEASKWEARCRAYEETTAVHLNSLLETVEYHRKHHAEGATAQEWAANCGRLQAEVSSLKAQQ